MTPPRPRGRRWPVQDLVLTSLLAALLAEIAFLLVVSRPSFRAWLHGELTRGGGRASFGAVGGWPFGITLDDVVFESPATSNLKRLRAPRARAVVEWPPLLRERRLVLRRVVLSDAEIEVRIEGGAPDRIALPLPVREVGLVRTKVHVANLSGWTLEMRGVDGSLVQEGAGDATVLSGAVEMARADVGRVSLEAAWGEFRLASGRLQVPVFDARLCGGDLRASGSLRLDAPQSLEGLAVRLERAEVLPLLRRLDYSERFSGKISLEGEASGPFTPAVRGLAGEGRASVESFGARLDLPPLNVFNVAPTLGELRRVEGLAGAFRLRLAGPRAEITDLVLGNAELRVVGSGTVSLAGALAVDGRAALGARLSRGIPGFVASSLERTPEGGLLVPFRLEKTLAEPSVRLGAVFGRALLRPLKKVF